jgi:hypothetical protein
MRKEDAAAAAADGVPRERIDREWPRVITIGCATPAGPARGSTDKMWCADLDSLRQPVDQSEGAGDKVAD